MKKLINVLSVALFVVFAGYNVYQSQKAEVMSEIAIENVEALADDELASWWDFFNNYIVEERIPINTTTCLGGKVSYKGITFSIESCTQYTYAIYHYCYDGGSADQCISSGVKDYI